MAEQTEIDAVDMVRRIRDEQARLLEGKSDAETMDLFRKTGEMARQRAAERSSNPKQPDQDRRA